MEGRRHDLRNILNGMDGTLLVLAEQRRSMSESQVDRTIAALRQEIHCLQLLASEGAQACTYDLSELLNAICAIRSSGCGDVTADIEPGLVVEGRPDRLAFAVDGLLVNVAVHAPGATAALGARRAGEMIEVVVSDDGPGLRDEELELACEIGWRGSRSAHLPGSGLGLARVRELVRADGGDVVLEPTRPAVHAGRPGLTVRLQVPVCQATAATR
jgi:signal transduction histidine kinase